MNYLTKTTFVDTKLVYTHTIKYAQRITWINTRASHQFRWFFIKAHASKTSEKREVLVTGVIFMDLEQTHTQTILYLS